MPSPFPITLLQMQGPSRSWKRLEGWDRIPSFPFQQADAPSNRELPSVVFWSAEQPAYAPDTISECWWWELGWLDGTRGDPSIGTCPVLLPPGCAERCWFKSCLEVESPQNTGNFWITFLCLGGLFSAAGSLRQQYFACNPIHRNVNRVSEETF